MSKPIDMEFFYKLVENGWMPNYDENYEMDGYGVYEFTLIAQTYESRCFAYISKNKEGIHISGHLGVAFINVEYEYQDRPYSVSDLEDMLAAINCAEKNLLAIGMPFEDNKNFHGTQEEIEEKIKRNTELRKQWNLDEIEKELWEKIQ